jgi:hypothetical protein
MSWLWRFLDAGFISFGVKEPTLSNIKIKSGDGILNIHTGIYSLIIWPYGTCMEQSCPFCISYWMQVS